MRVKLLELTLERSQCWASEKKYRYDLVAIAFLAILDCAFLWQIFVPGRVLMPLDLLNRYLPWSALGVQQPVYNPLLSDVAVYIYPVKHYAAEVVKRGTIPLWNPYMYSGYPFIGNAQAAIFYPLSVLFYLLPEPAAINASAWLHLLIAGVGMYLYIRVLDRSRIAALFSAIAFMFNGVLVVWLEWTSVVSAAAWLPLVLFFFELALRKKRPVYVVLTGISLAMQMLGGHLQWSLYGLFAEALYFAFRTVYVWAATRKLRDGLEAGVISLGAAALGFGLSAIQLLPTLEYIRVGQRGIVPYESMVAGGALNRLIVFLVPNFFGNPISNNFWGASNYAEQTAYFGVLPLLLALTAPFWKRDYTICFFTGLLILTLALAAGSPLYRLVYFLPGFNGLPVQRMIYLVAFSACVLAGLSLDALAGHWPERQRGRWAGLIGVSLFLLAVCGYYVSRNIGPVREHWRYESAYLGWFVVLLLAGAGLIGLRLAGRLNAANMGILAIGVTIADMFVFGVNYNPVTLTKDWYPLTDSIRFLQSDPDVFRMMSLRDDQVLRPNLPSIFGIADVGGYDSVFLVRYAKFLEVADSGSPLYPYNHNILQLNKYGSRLHDLLNIKYIVTTFSLPNSAPNGFRQSVEQPVGDSVVWLDEHSQVGQSFIAPHPRLNRIDVMFAHQGTSSRGTLQFHLRAAPSGPDLAAESVEVSQLERDGYYAFSFEPIPDSRGRGFYFMLECPTCSAQDSSRVGVWASVGDAYTNGARYADSQPASGDLRFAAYSDFFLELVYDKEVKIYRRKDYYPRAFAVYRADNIPDDAGILARLQDANYDLRQNVILEEPLNEDQRLEQAPVLADGAEARNLNYGSNTVTLDVSMAHNGLVVFGDVYYPGWKAFVDGRETRVHRADYTFRAVFVEKGDHHVEFVFWPTSFQVGACLSLFSLVFSVGLVILLRPSFPRFAEG